MFSIGQRGDEFSALKDHLAALDAPILQQSILYRRALARNELSHPLSLWGKPVWDSLHALTCDSGGVLAGHGEAICLLSDQVLAGKAFLHLGKQKQALALAEFLLSRLEALHYLPLAMSAESVAVGAEPTDRERFLYPCVAHFFLDLAAVCRENTKRQRYENAARQLFSLTEETVGKDGFGFSGIEFAMRKNALPPERLLYGNTAAACDYLTLVKRLTEKEAGIDPFLSENLTLDDPRRLGKLRLPETVYGPCGACRPDARYVGWLKRAKFGSYLCPACYAKGQRETVSSVGDVILPGSYALCCRQLWQAGLMDLARLCRNTKRCLDCLDQVPEQVSFYETALLASVLAELGDPAHRALQERLDRALAQRAFPLASAECAAYLLAQPPR